MTLRRSNKIKRSYISGMFGQIHLRIAKPEKSFARPILCIHISPLSGIVYEKVLEQLSSDRIAIAPDTPGYGMSDAPENPPNIETYADAMKSLVDKLQLNEIDVIGYGTGSKIAFQLGLSHPKTVKNAILISAPDYTESEISKMNETLGKHIEAKDDGSHLIELWQQVKGFPDNNLRMKVFPDHIRSGRKKPWGPRAAFAYRYKEKLDDFIPNLLVININNEITEPTRRLGNFLDTHRYIEKLNWRHGFLEKSTEEFIDIVRDFVDQK